MSCIVPMAIWGPVNVKWFVNLIYYAFFCFSFLMYLKGKLSPEKGQKTLPGSSFNQFVST